MKNGIRHEWNREPGQHQMILLKGDTTTNISRAGRSIHGPALITYTTHADKGIDATEQPLPKYGALLEYTGPEIKPSHAAGLMRVPANAEVRLISWYAGHDQRGARLAEVEWPDMPRVTFYLKHQDLRPKQ